MPLLNRRSRAQIKADADREAVKRAVAEFAKAVSSGSNVVLPGSQFSGAFSPLGSNNLGNAAMAMVQRVSASMAQQTGVPVAEIEAELAEQGLTWGPSFPPGRPLDPFFGYRRPPRTWDFQVGENVQVTPRWNRLSFQTIKGIWDSYDVAQICTRHLINDVRSLDYNWEPLTGVRDDVSEDIEKAQAFWAFPDRRLPFRAWLAEYLMDVIRYDAGCLYHRHTEGGDLIGVEVVDGTTVIPLVDYYGRPAADEDDSDPPEDVWDGGDTPAFVQIIQGMPWVWLTVDDITYIPWNPMPESQYGLAPLESVLLTANTDIRFQWHFLQYFTEGTIPAGFMEAPPDMSDPSQIQEWQETWNAVMQGDQAQKQQIRWVPSGSKFTAVKDESFDKEFPLYLMRRVAAAHGVTPADLGFTEDVNKASGDTQIDVQFRVGTTPLLRHVEDVVNLINVKDLGLRCRLKFDTGGETEDRIATAQADKIYIEAGVLSPDEPRKRLGYAIDKERPIARFINNTRTGPIPLLALESMAGKIDEETYAPDKGQPLVSNPYMPVPGTLPDATSPEGKAGLQASAQAGRDVLAATSGGQPSGAMQALIAQNTPPPAGQQDSTSPQPAQAQTNDDDGDAQAAKNTTAGITAETGIQGVDLQGVDYDDEDDKDEATKELELALELRRWRENARNRLRKGLKPRPFHSTLLDQPTIDGVWGKLQGASTRQEVDAIFADAVPLAAARKGFGVEAAGLIVQALDTGRVLLVQRADDLTWEFPGGKLDDDDRGIWDGALREFEEETGATLDEDATHAGSFLSPDGAYQAYVVQTPSEQDLTLEPQSEEISDIGWWDPADLDSDRVRDKAQELVPQMGRFLKGAGSHSKRSGMVSLDIAPGTLPAFPGGVDDHHITIVFLGRDVDDEMFDSVCERAATTAAQMAPPSGTIGGLGSFPPSESSDWQTPVFAVPDVPACADLRDAFEDFNASEHRDYKPHVTLSYVGEGEPTPDPVPDTPVTFAHLSVHRGDDVRRFPFGHLSKAATFHAHTDQIVAHHAHHLAAALRGLITDEAIHDAIEAAHGEVVDVYKPDTDPFALEKRTPLAAAVIAALRNGIGSFQKLRDALTEIWGDAALQGSNGAARAAGGTILASLRGVTAELPDDYWSHWTPGWGRAAAKLADGGLGRLLDQADVTIRGLVDTTIQRLGDQIAQSVAAGDSIDATAKRAREVISDPKRAWLIADTETARAMTAASMDTYRANNVDRLEWIAEADACPLCLANEAASPIAIDNTWPDGTVPVHPRCRCAVLPHIDV